LNIINVHKIIETFSLFSTSLSLVAASDPCEMAIEFYKEFFS